MICRAFMTIVFFFCLFFGAATGLDAAKQGGKKQSNRAAIAKKITPSDDTMPNPTGLTIHSRQALLIDTKTGAVLFERRADDLAPPSSMTKIMTAFLVFEDLKAGRISLNTPMEVSEKAWRMAGSKMFVALNDKIPVADLLRGVIIQSGNDASVVLAEGIAGSEGAFADRMTRRAHELGAVHTTFKNATGWPDPDHLSTARDLAVIAQKTIALFPDYYYLYGEKEFTYNKIRQGNRNPLLGTAGCDGLKTGSTDAGGFGVVASSLQEGRRLILVINGASTKKERAVDGKNLMAWGFHTFVSPTLYRANDVVANADVWLGQDGTVPMVLERDLSVTLLRHRADQLKVQVTYDGPIPAPITRGQRIGTLTVTLPDRAPLELALLSQKDVAKAGLFQRLSAAVHYLFWGHN